MKRVLLVSLLFSLALLLLLPSGCGRRIRPVLELQKGVWYISPDLDLALMFTHDGSTVRGEYVRTTSALAAPMPFEGHTTRRGELVIPFVDDPELTLRGTLQVAPYGYLFTSADGTGYRFRAEPRWTIPRVTGRYAIPTFANVIRRETVYGYAPGYYASKPVPDMSPAAYPSIILSVLQDVTVNLFRDSIRLDMDIYRPAEDSMEKRPLLVLIHGGAFVVGDKRDELVSRLATYYAQCGYVVASINYRMGYPFIPGMYSQLERAIYRGVQDVRAALRFLSDHSTEYGIDPDQVILAGHSAGGFYSLLTAFKNEGEEWPSSLGSRWGLRRELGCLDCSGNQHTGQYSIIGVVNMWGGITELEIIEPHEKIPVLLIHGTDDRIVPYGYDFPFARIDRRLTAFFTRRMYGSEPIYQHMRRLGMEVRLVPLEDAPHEPQKDNPLIFDEIRHELTSFMFERLGGPPLRLTGPETVSTAMEPARYIVANRMDEEVRWHVQGGVIVRRGYNWVDVVWFDNAMQYQITAATVNSIGLVKRDNLTVSQQLPL